MRQRAVMALYWGWMTLLGLAFYAFPEAHMYLWAAIGSSSATAILVGLLHHRPRRIAPWLILAAGVLTFTAGDTVYDVLVDIVGQDNPFPSAADAFYLVSGPLLALGLVLLSRSGVAQRDRAGLLDSLALTLSLGLLSWLYLIQPSVLDPGLTVIQRIITIAYPVNDILILATVLRLLTLARRGPAIALLMVGAAGLLTSDVSYGLSQLAGAWAVGGPTDLGWMLFYACWGAAALHPSMTRLSEPRPITRGELTPWRLGLLLISSLIPPMVLLAQSLSGPVEDGEVIAVLSTVMFALVLARLSGAVEINKTDRSRGQALRRFDAALVSAGTRDQVVAAMHVAVAELIPPGEEHGSVLVAPDPGPATEPAATVELTFVRTLESSVAAKLADFDTVIRCPVPVGPAASRAGFGGELVVAAAESTLASLANPLQTMVLHSASALERVALNEDVKRRVSDEYFRTLIRSSTDVIIILDEANRIRYASPAADDVFGTDTLDGLGVVDLVHPNDWVLVRRTIEAVRSGIPIAGTADWTVIGIDAGQIKVEVACRDLRADPTVNGLVLTLRDVTERRRLEAELTRSALHDGLTGLANRVLFNERAGRAAMRSRRDGTIGGVLIVDLDNFKQINESRGHHMGDALLLAVGRRLSEVVGGHETVARLGSDEFAILVEQAAHSDVLADLAERLTDALSRPFEVGGEILTTSASVGVAMTANAEDETELLRQADLALQQAKGAGKNNWRWYEAGLHSALVQRLELRAALERAVTDQAFVLYYQPIVELASGRATGVEALVRWNDPDRGLVPPGQFIELAEETGLIVPLGKWVLDHAIATVAGWHRDLGMPVPPYVSVNVSVKQFRTPGFVDLVRRSLAEHGLPPTSLLLEITESLLLRDDEQVLADLTVLRGMGVRIAIDDFGTGYSSLSYLREMPIDIVKIDKSFVDGMAGSAQQSALVDGIIRLAHTLGLDVVAEGIEDEQARAQLAAMGCRLGQGYLFAKPLPAAEAARFLAQATVAALAG